jgi:hypothetical protein
MQSTPSLPVSLVSFFNIILLYRAQIKVQTKTIKTLAYFSDFRRLFHFDRLVKEPVDKCWLVLPILRLVVRKSQPFKPTLCLV